MRQFKTTGIVALSDGVVEMTPAQAKRRAGSLTRKGNTKQYEIDKPIQMKAGEIVGMTKAPKGMESLLIEIKKPAPKKAE